MTAASEIFLNYDEDADVLYLAIGQAVPASGEMEGGIIFRYSLATNTPCGATICGYKRGRWGKDSKALADTLSHKLPVASDDLFGALERRGV